MTGTMRKGAGVLPHSPAFRTIGMPTAFVELSTSARNSAQVTFFRVGAAATAAATTVIDPTTARSPSVERVRMTFFYPRFGGASNRRSVDGRATTTRTPRRKVCNGTPGALTELLAKARKNNQALGVSGLLLYHRGSFLQVLEGEEQVVDALFPFAGWSMGFVELSSEAARRREGFSSYFQKGRIDLSGDAERITRILGERGTRSPPPR